MVRNKSTTKPSLNGSLLPGLPDLFHRIFGRGWALEVGRILCDCSHKLHQALTLLWSDYGGNQYRRATHRVVEIGLRTVGVLAHLDHPRANTQEEHAVFLVLGVELGHDHVQGRLGGRVQGTYLNLHQVSRIDICETGGDGDDFLGLALQDKWEKQVEEMDVSSDVGLE